MKILIKLSGKIIDDDIKLKNFINNIKKIYKKNKIVIIHGGGKQLSFWLDRLNLKTKFIDGIRFTNKDVLEVAISILCGLVNKFLVFKFINAGFKKVVGLSCIDAKMIITDIYKDLGFVGKKLIWSNLDLLNLLIKNNYLVLLSSIALGKDNKKLSVVNVNSDDIVYFISNKIFFDKIIFLSDVEGVYDNKGFIIDSLNIKEIDVLISKKIVKNGMIPKILAIKKLLNKGVKEVVVSDNLFKKGTKFFNK